MRKRLNNGSTGVSDTLIKTKSSPARWLVVSNSLDAGGRSATDVALDVLAVLVLGAGTAQMGMLMTFSGLGFLFLGVPIGIFIDRHLSPRLLVATGLAKATLIGTLVAAWALDALTFGHLAAVMTLLGILTVLAETSQAALVPRLVAQDAVGRLTARLESADAALGIIIPAAAGLLTGALGAGPVLGIAAAFLASAAVVALKIRMSPRTVVDTPSQGTATFAATVVLSRWAQFWNDATQGWVTLRHTPVLWLLTLNVTVGNIGMALFAPVEAVWVLTELELGPEFVGFQLTAGAIGALVASMAAGRTIDTLGERGSILLGSAGCIVAVGLNLAALFDRDHAAPFLLASTALWGFMIILVNITNSAIFARSCPEGTLGRVTAMRRTLTRGTAPLATLSGGALGAWLGVGWVLTGWLVLSFFAFILALAATRVLKHPL